MIKLFHPGDDSPVFDPFCGSGTTLVEAQLAGLSSVGVDVNPIAALVSKVKTTPVSTSLGPVAKEITAAARKDVVAGSITIPEIPRLDHWFMKPVQEALASTVREINLLKNADIADALRVALSSIIVRVSNQDSDTRYAAVEKKVTREDVWNGFEKAATSVSSALEGAGTDSSEPRGR